MGQAVTVKYLPATNFKPSRYKAICEAGSVTISKPMDCSDEDGEYRAVKALLDKINARGGHWDYDGWTRGGDNSASFFVNVKWGGVRNLKGV